MLFIVNYFYKQVNNQRMRGIGPTAASAFLDSEKDSLERLPFSGEGIFVTYGV